MLVEFLNWFQTILNGVEPNLTSEPSDHQHHQSTIPEPEPSSDINFSLAKPKSIQTKHEPPENQDKPEPTFSQPKPNQPVIIKPNKPVAINFSGLFQNNYLQLLYSEVGNFTFQRVLNTNFAYKISRESSYIKFYRLFR